MRSDPPPRRVPPGRPRSSPRTAFGPGDVPIDPYLLWAADTNYVYLPGFQTDNPKQPLPILIKLKGGLTAKNFARKDWGHGIPVPGDMDDWFAIPAVYANLPDALDALEYCTAEVNRDSVHRLFEGSFASVIEYFELSDPLGTIQTTLGTQQIVKKTAGWNPKVIVGVIDDGLPFANERFRDGSASTRIEFFWDQDRPVGQHLPKSVIDTYLTNCTHAGLVDEDEVHGMAGYRFNVSGHKSWARRATHGGHVMDLACGLDISEVTSDSPHIIAVGLPNEVTADPAGVRLQAQAVTGVVYIIYHAIVVSLAYKVSPPLPIVINLSYGINQGPHDGTSTFEDTIDRITFLLRNAGIRFTLVLAAGNSHLTRCHAHFGLSPAGGPSPSRTLEWRVQPDDATSSFMDIWLPYDAQANQIEIEIDTPDRSHIGPIHEGDPDVFWPLPSAFVLKVRYPAVPLYLFRKVITLTLNPTTTFGSDLVAASGTWRITVRNVRASVVAIDAWIWRDDTPFGYPIRGRQSRFDDAAYKRFDSKGHLLEDDVVGGPSYIKRKDSISGLATGRYTVVIGGCRRSDLKPARYSAGGPTLRPRASIPPRLGPDATAYAEWSVAHTGMLSSGTRSGSIVTVNGTSVAAPQVTRWIASSMAAGGPGNRMDVANQGATDPTPDIPPERGNYGYVDPGYSTIKVDRNAPL